jgi:hypothetical protein
MTTEYSCDRCGYIGPPPGRGQVIDWIAAVFGMVFGSPGTVEVLRDLLYPPCPSCHRRSSKNRGSAGAA